MTAGMVLAILKQIASSTYRGRLGRALIDQVCRPYNLTDADVFQVINRLVEQDLRYQRLRGDCGDNSRGEHSRSPIFLKAGEN